MTFTSPIRVAGWRTGGIDWYCLLIEEECRTAREEEEAHAKWAKPRTRRMWASRVMDNATGQKIHRVGLADEERDELGRLADDGIESALGVGAATVKRMRKCCVVEGIDAGGHRRPPPAGPPPPAAGRARGGAGFGAAP
ncbi:MAG: hypothetical protein OXI01_07990, partial [Albidovulum sp.]|nr:hypothetical protein [Albidovulum sp.]